VQKAIFDFPAPRCPWCQVVPHYSLASRCPPGQESRVKLVASRCHIRFLP